MERGMWENTTKARRLETEAKKRWGRLYPGLIRGIRDIRGRTPNSRERGLNHG